MSIAFDRQTQQRQQQSYEEAWRATRASLAAQPTQPLRVRSAPSWGAGNARRKGTVSGHIVAGGISLLVVWEVLYALLNVGDLVSTWVGLRAGLSEGNPLMHNLLGVTGFGGLIGYKVLVTVVVVLGVGILHRWQPRVAHLTIWMCNVLTLAAVLLNVLQITFWR